MMRVALLSLLASVGLALFTPSSSGAQDGPTAAHDAEAQALFQAGRVAFSDGRYEDALQHFRRSYELSRRPELLYNIGNAADRLQHEEEALEAFEAYLREMSEPPNEREVRARIAVLRERVETPDTAATTPPPEDEVDAASAPVLDPIAAEAPDAAPSGGGIESEWWLWTLIGGVVVGAAALVTVLVLVNQEPSYTDYTLGDDMVVHLTLTGTF